MVLGHRFGVPMTQGWDRRVAWSSTIFEAVFYVNGSQKPFWVFDMEFL
jgi:hypothetical protein